ncbi:MAG: SPOR domain-containing protein [Xanthomonadales bacterium]|nr:SPOR domain-containing protein [Xanthomonadales bacterium]
MSARILVVALVVLNVAAALWNWLAVPASPAVSVPAVIEPGVPPLILLAEQAAGTNLDAAELVAAPEPPAEDGAAAVPQVCVEIGPFGNQSALREAELALAAIGSVQSVRETVERRSRGFWVHLPPATSRDQALTMARRLAEEGVDDYYVVTAGDSENTISLGLFRDRANAERRRREMVGRGYPAQLTDRVEEQVIHWLTLRQPATAADGTAAADWRPRLAAGGDLAAEPVACDEARFQ